MSVFTAVSRNAAAVEFVRGQRRIQVAEEHHDPGERAWPNDQGTFYAAEDQFPKTR